MPPVYCLKCEAPVTGAELGRELRHMQWQAAMDKSRKAPQAFTDAKKERDDGWPE